jgi:hypothetical protein
MTDAEGAFTVGGLLAGRYELSASSNRGEATVQEPILDGRPVTITLRSDGSRLGPLSGAEGTPQGSSAMR